MIKLIKVVLFFLLLIGLGVVGDIFLLKIGGKIYWEFLGKIFLFLKKVRMMRLCFFVCFFLRLDIEYIWNCYSYFVIVKRVELI